MHLKSVYGSAHPRYAYFINPEPSLLEQQPASVASYSVGSGEQPFIEPFFLGFDKQYHKIKVLADTGNDVTLIQRKTALEMGIDPVQLKANTFPVSGISGPPAEFKEIKTLVVFEKLRPTWVTVGLAQRDEDLVENLLGRKDLLDTGKYEFVYDNDSVDIRERHQNFNLSNGYNEWGTGSYSQGLPSQTREKLSPVRQTDLI